MDDDVDALEIAKAIAAHLELGLDNFGAEDVRLTRDEAVLALGLISALVEQLQAGAATGTSTIPAIC